MAEVVQGLIRRLRMIPKSLPMLILQTPMKNYREIYSLSKTVQIDGSYTLMPASVKPSTQAETTENSNRPTI